jgi:peptidoglycan/LPS O-acetylase OafA/YrhL
VQRQLPTLHGIAILTVILNHSVSLTIYIGQHFGLDQPTGIEYLVLTFLKTFGFFAVPIFLFSSGSFFVYSAHGKDVKSAYRTVWAGLKRLVLPYLIWSIIFYALLFFLEGPQYTFTGYIKNLLVGYPYNFVPLLFVLYGLAPLLVILARRLPWLLIIGFLIYQLYLLNAVFPGALGFSFPSWALFLSPPVIRLPFATWGVFFPLGIVFTLYSNSLTPHIRRLVGVLVPAAIVFFIGIFLHDSELIYFPVSQILFPLALVPVLTLLRRDSLPQAQRLERVGKRAYGIYLMNLVIIDILLLGLHAAVPWLFGFPIILSLLVFVLASSMITLLFEFALRHPVTKVYQVVFG